MCLYTLSPSENHKRILGHAKKATIKGHPCLVGYKHFLVEGKDGQFSIRNRYFAITQKGITSGWQKEHNTERLKTNSDYLYLNGFHAYLNQKIAKLESFLASDDRVMFGIFVPIYFYPKDVLELGTQELAGIIKEKWTNFQASTVVLDRYFIKKRDLIEALQKSKHLPKNWQQRMTI